MVAPDWILSMRRIEPFKNSYSLGTLDIRA